MENIYDLFYQKLVGDLTPEEFSKRYNEHIFEDIKDINSKELYEGI